MSLRDILSSIAERSLPLRLTLKTLGNVLLVFAMNKIIPDYFVVFGGVPAFVIIGILITFFNFLVRPILDILTLPLKLTMNILATIVINGGILWLTWRLTLLMDPNLIALVIGGGIGGWIVASLVFGLCNWVLRKVLK